jgi:hypothetical protein
MDQGEELFTLALGRAVIKRWGSLPREVQEEIFKDAAAVAPGVASTFRERLAVFLHDLA